MQICDDLASSNSSGAALAIEMPSGNPGRLLPPVSEWLDEYDPDELDVFPIEVALGRIAARRNAAAKRILKPAND